MNKFIVISVALAALAAVSAKDTTVSSNREPKLFFNRGWGGWKRPIETVYITYPKKGWGWQGGYGGGGGHGGGHHHIPIHHHGGHGGGGGGWGWPGSYGGGHGGFGGGGGGGWGGGWQFPGPGQFSSAYYGGGGGYGGGKKGGKGGKKGGGGYERGLQYVRVPVAPVVPIYDDDVIEPEYDEPYAYEPDFGVPSYYPSYYDESEYY